MNTQDLQLNQIAEWKEKAGKWDLAKENIEKISHKLRDIANEYIAKSNDLKELANEMFPELPSLNPIRTKRSKKLIAQLHNDVLDEVREHITNKTPYNLVEIAKKYKVKVISQVNKGLASARNTGIMNAQGTWVLPLDADDMLTENYYMLYEEDITNGIVWLFS